MSNVDAEAAGDLAEGDEDPTDERPAVSAMDLLLFRYMSDVLFFILAIFTMHIGLRMWGMLPPESPVAVVAIILTFTWGLFLLVLAVIQFDTGYYGHLLAFGTLAILLVGTIALLIDLPKPYLGTDVVLFSKRAARLSLAGTNPYQASMIPAIYNLHPPGELAAPGAKTAMITPLTTGGVVSSFSYPAGAFLWFVPQTYFGVGRASLLTSMVVPALALVAVLVRISPPELAALPLLATLGARNVIIGALGGLNDTMWVLPVVLTIVLWYRERWAWAGVTFGVAVTMKQQPWFIAPFLAVWLYHAAPGWRAWLRRSVRFFGPATAVFVLVNLPYIVWSPEAWLRGVFTPLRDAHGALVTQGVGLALLTSADVYPLPKAYYMHLLVAWSLILLTVYAAYCDRLKWMAWLTPSLILLVNYRSLPTYFLYIIPVAYAAWLATTDLMWLEESYWGHLREVVS